MSGGPGSLPSFAQGGPTGLLGLQALMQTYGQGQAAGQGQQPDAPAAVPPGFTGYDPATPPTGAPTAVIQPGAAEAGRSALAGLAALVGPGGAQAASLADRIVGAESGGVATAKNPRSSATGAGQFIDGTWLDMMGRYRPDLAGSLPRDQLLALRNDPALSREMVDRYGQENGAKLRAAGLPDNDGTRYLSHVAGPAGARAVLSADPSTPVSQVLQPGQVAANPFMRAMTAGDLAGWAARKVGSGAPTMTMPGAAAGPARFGLTGAVPAPSGQAPAMAMPGQGAPVPDAGTGAYGEIEALLKGAAPQKAGAQPQGQERLRASGLSAIEASGGPTMTLAQARKLFDPSRFYAMLPRGARGR